MFFLCYLPRNWLHKPKEEKHFHQDNEGNSNSLIPKFTASRSHEKRCLIHTHYTSEGLAIPEVAQSRVCPRNIAEHERDWSHAIQRGHDQVMEFSPFFPVY